MDSTIRYLYHTQEKRDYELSTPVPTKNPEAWLGEGYYFWYYENDAIWWGRTAKKRTGFYQVYKAEIEFENILDTVFNEEHYIFWVKNVEKAIEKYIKNQKGEISLKYVNDFFKDKGIFEGIDGVLFQDITNNPDNWLVKKFQYKKRIQLAVYNLPIINTFALEFEAECT